MERLKKIINKLNKLKKPLEKKNRKKTNFLNFLFYPVFFLLGLFLIINIYYSQNFSEFFYQLVSLQKKSIIKFLEKIRQESFFLNQLAYFETFYGKEIKNQVFQKENEKKQLIKKLKQILEKNPKSRDVLYNLFLLTNDKNYLQQAKMIDPEVEKEMKTEK